MNLLNIKGMTVLVCAMITLQTFGQSEKDTLTMVGELNKVMEFATKPYLYYTDQTVLDGYDNDLQLNRQTSGAIFYKVGNDLYYGNEQEQIYLQDSLFITVNNKRKAIQLNRVDAEAKKKINLMPLQKIDAQKMLKERYVIGIEDSAGDKSTITLTSKENYSNRTSVIKITYIKQTHLPLSMEIDVIMKQPASQDAAAMLSAKGLDTSKFIKQIDGADYIVITQKAAIYFNQIDLTQAAATKMPLWTDKIAYDARLQLFSGKGEWEGYEVIKTF